jgi:Flp pilus assembly protein TadD
LLILLFLFLAVADSPTQLLQKGLVALQHGNLAQARSAFEEVTKTDPRNPYAWASLAETYARLKQPADASAAAAKAEEFGVDNPNISHALAMYYSKDGQFEHAAKLERKFAASPGADPAAGIRAAALFLNAGNASEALRLAEEAAAQHPSPEAEDVLGRVLVAAARPADGEKHLASAWQGQKTNPQFAFDYGQALLRKQDFSHAADVVATSLQANPDDAQLVLALGVARYGQRRFEDAITAFLRVIRTDPDVEQPYLFLGKMLDQAGGHLAEITAAGEKWLARDPANSQAFLMLAKSRLAADPKDGTAEGLLRRSIALKNADWEAHYELGVLLEGKHDWRNAAAELERSAALDAKQPMPHYHLARVYDRRGEAEKAQAERALHEQLTK